MEIRKAKKENVEEILNIYKSLINCSGCAWDEYYPGIEDVQNDIEKDSLYIMLEEDRIVGVAATSKDDELMELNCWNREMKNPCELVRVGVLKEYQNRGLAKQIIKYIEKDVLTRGFDGIYLIASKNNSSAINLYNSLNYICCGETTMYDMEWFCYEKKLK